MISNNDSYATMMSQSVSGLFKDPVRDSTKAKQNSVLLFSVASILLAQKIILPLQTQEIGGIQGTISSPDVIIWATGCTALYFAVVYAISFFQDIMKYQYEKIEMINALMKSSTQTAQDAVSIASATLESKEEQQIQIKYSQLRKLEIDKLKNPAIDQKTKEQTLKNIELLNTKMLEEIRTINSKRSVAMKSIRKRSQSEEWAIVVHKWLSYLRIFLEFIFPIGLAAVAIYQSLILTGFFGKLLSSVFP